MTSDNQITPNDWSAMMSTLHEAAANSKASLALAKEARADVHEIKTVVVGDGDTIGIKTRMDLNEAAIADLQSQRREAVAWIAGVGGVVAGGILVWVLTGSPA